MNEVMEQCNTKVLTMIKKDEETPFSNMNKKIKRERKDMADING